MATATTSRIARLHQMGESTVLGLTDRRGTTFYRFHEGAGCALGRVFRLVKADQGDGLQDHYTVILGTPELGNEDYSSCNCKGHQKYRHCKHVESIRAMIAAGRIETPGF